ncbi:MAG TPA: DUF3306 domain-containing protein [Steroidobacteraceae bacterium]
MSAQEPRDLDAEPGADEMFLSRWARRKARARAEPSAPAADMPPLAEPAPPPPDAAEAAAATPAIELPDLDQLGEDSDYSAFLTPGVDAGLRQRALRKLFASPKFNVFDGLDTYRDDYTQFPALGSVVTADMRHHVERLARKVADTLLDDPASVATPASAAAVTDAAPVEPEVTAAEPAAPDEDNHDRPA